ncbi:MAG TPA: MFS transporter [Rectinemataceae bacterium]|nr:MFS transporter [Rectinemataceae bacterium]
MKRDTRFIRFGLVYFVMFTIFGVATPYLQILVRGLGYDPAQVGFLLGLFEVAGVTGPLLLGGLGDRMPSPRPALAALALVAVAAMIPLLLLPRFAFSALALCLVALGIRTLIPLADASAVTFSDRGTAGRGAAHYGRIRVFGSAGFIAATLTLQALPRFAHASPSSIALAFSLAALAFCLSLIILPVTGKSPRQGEPASRNSARRIDPLFLLGLCIIALGRMAMAPISSFLSLYVAEDLRWNAVGGLWALSACTEMPLMLLSVRIIRRTGPMAAIAISSAALVVRLAVYALVPSPAGVVSGQLLHSLSYGLFQPAAVTFVATRVPPERRVRGMAAFMSLGVGLPTFAGSSLGGLVLKAWGYRVLFASFVLFALASLLLYVLTRRRFSEGHAYSRPSG